ncbi:MAG: 3'-5' exonuclease [Bacteroidaceae bacterium]|nr:3'-5' exonuclease [Bacteroidaceae bacterium]
MDNKNIVWFDLETTGLVIAKDSIVEISAIKTDSDLNEIDRFYSLVQPFGEYEMSPVAQEKHGLSKEDLADSPYFKDIADSLLDFIEDCDLGGYNIGHFDLAMLVEEFLRAKKVFNYKNRNIIDSYSIYNKWESRKLEDYYFRLFGEKLENAHTAEADILATIRVFKKQKEMYALPSNEEIDAICFEEKNNKLDLAQKFIIDRDESGERKDIKFNFGKWKGYSIYEVILKDSTYFDWVINNRDFAKETRIMAKKLKTIAENGSF